MIEISDDTVTMTIAEYDNLMDSYMLLQSLRNAGVDNWCGWDDGRDEYFAWRDGE